MLHADWSGNLYHHHRVSQCAGPLRRACPHTKKKVAGDIFLGEATTLLAAGRHFFDR